MSLLDYLLEPPGRTAKKTFPETSPLSPHSPRKTREAPAQSAGRWIHRPWDENTTTAGVCVAAQVEQTTCWHCQGSGRCDCIACWRRHPGELAACVVCRRSGLAKMVTQ
jgi:hypothetical protein